MTAIHYQKKSCITFYFQVFLSTNVTDFVKEDLFLEQTLDYLNYVYFFPNDRKISIHTQQSLQVMVGHVLYTNER